MQAQEFCRRFRGDIRVCFDWDKFCTELWPIEVVSFQLPNDGSSLFTPWYALPDGTVCPFNAAGAIPQSLEVAAANDALCKSHQVAEWRGSSQTIEAPSYELPDGKVLLLDGNHRAVAAQKSHRPIALTAFVVCGPLTQSVCPDLMHWA